MSDRIEMTVHEENLRDAMRDEAIADLSTNTGGDRG